MRQRFRTKIKILSGEPGLKKLLPQITGKSSEWLKKLLAELIQHIKVFICTDRDRLPQGWIQVFEVDIPDIMAEDIKEVYIGIVIDFGLFLKIAPGIRLY